MFKSRKILICETNLERIEFQTDSFIAHSLNIHAETETMISKFNKTNELCFDGENVATNFCLECPEYLYAGCARLH